MKTPPLEELKALKFMELQGVLSGVSIITYAVEADWAYNRGIGIDPGRNFAIAEIGYGGITLTYGKLPKRENAWEYGIDLFKYIKEVYQHEDLCTPITVEGASYGDQFGQTALAYVRMGIIVAWADLHNETCKVVPPASIRKQVLGSAKLSGKVLWPSINHNAGDALVMGLHAAGYRYDD